MPSPTYPSRFVSPHAESFSLAKKKFKDGITTDMGSNRTRRIVSTNNYVITAQFDFKQDSEYKDFLKWMKYDLDYGSLWFIADWFADIGFTAGQWVFRFVNMPFRASGYDQRYGVTLLVGPRNDNVVNSEYTELGIELIGCEYPFDCTGYDWADHIPENGYYPESEGGVLPPSPYTTEYCDEFESLPCSGSWSAPVYKGTAPNNPQDWTIGSCSAIKRISVGVFGGYGPTPPVVQTSVTPSAPTLTIDPSCIDPSSYLGKTWGNNVGDEVNYFGGGVYDATILPTNNAGGLQWFPVSPTVRAAYQFCTASYTTGNTQWSQVGYSAPPAPYNIAQGAVVPGYEKLKFDTGKLEAVTEARSLVIKIPPGGDGGCLIDSGIVDFEYRANMMLVNGATNHSLDFKIEWYSDASGVDLISTSTMAQYSTHSGTTWTDTNLTGTVPYGARYFRVYVKFNNPNLLGYIYGYIVDTTGLRFFY